MLDENFIKQHFGVIKWYGDKVDAKRAGKVRVKGGKILLTHYMTLCCTGSYQKTEQSPYALYQVLGNRPAFSFTKQEVLRGVLTLPEHKKKVRPLVWLSRDDVETILLQGNCFIRMPDGKLRFLYAHLHNNIAYDKSIKNSREQRRYWYFKERKEGGAALWEKYQQRNNVVLAGDIYNIGVGKLVLLRYQNLKTRKYEMRLGIIADTGAAFYNNLYQLDSFAGVISNQRQLSQHISHMLDTVDAYLLYKKT